LNPGAKSDAAIGKISVGGRIERAIINAGVDTGLIGKNADAQIGPVIVGGDWISSSLVAGVQAGANAVFGDSDDAKIDELAATGSPDSPAIVSKIAKVTIKGMAIGTVNRIDNALFGIEAQRIVSIKVGGTSIPLTAGASNDLFAKRRPLGATFGTSDPDGFDFHAFEVL
jgi:hypothetical protein